MPHENWNDERVNDSILELYLRALDALQPLRLLSPSQTAVLPDILSQPLVNFTRRQDH